MSSQSEPQRLQDVARDLLNLQKLCNSIPNVPTQDAKENFESTTTPSKKEITESLPMKVSESQLIEISNRAENKSENTITAATINMNRVASEPSAGQAQGLQSHSKTASSSK